MQRRKTVRLHESQLRSIVQAIIAENANRNTPEFSVPSGAVGMTVKTYLLADLHEAELGKYMERGMKIVLKDEDKQDELEELMLDSDDDDEREWAEGALKDLKKERKKPHLAGYQIREVKGLLHVDIHAKTPWGLDTLEMLARNCEEDWGDLNARKAYMAKAAKLGQDAEIESRMDKHLNLKPTLPSWGSAMPASKYGLD